MTVLRQFGRFLLWQGLWAAFLFTCLALPAPLPWQVRLAYGLVWAIGGQWLLYLLLATRKAGAVVINVADRATGVWLEQRVETLVASLTAVLVRQADQRTLAYDQRREIVADVWNQWQPELDELLSQWQQQDEIRQWLPPRLAQWIDAGIENRYRERLHDFIHTGISDIVGALPPVETMQQAGSDILTQQIRKQATRWIEANWGDTLRLIIRGWRWTMTGLWIVFLLPLAGWGVIIGVAWLMG